MIKTIIIEDEKPAARRLKRLVEENGLEVVEMLHSVSQSIIWFKQNPAPDLIFLDIQLSDGLSFEIFEKVKIHKPIIFTTAYDSYMLKAFKMNSLDYLLKPIDSDELKYSIKKFQNQSHLIENREDFLFSEIKKLKELLFQNKAYKERFTVYIGSTIKLIEATDIECFRSVEKATFAITKHGKEYLLDGSLDALFEQLNPKFFFKINRKYIINLDSIKEIVAFTNNRLQIKLIFFNEETLIVSREKVKYFKEWLNQ